MSKKHQYKYLSSKKSKAIALILCVMFGFFGLHYFYVKRPCRGALNLLLLLLLTIASSVFGIYYIQITFGPTNGIFIHWREAVAVVSAAILGLTWIWDIVRIFKGQFRDNKKLVLK